MPLTARVWDGVDELKRRKLLVLAAIAGVLAAACSGAAGFDGIPTYEIDRDAYKTPVARAIELERLVLGSPEDCIERIRTWNREVGADYFLIRFRHPAGPSHESVLRALALFGHAVIPAFQGGRP